MERIDRPGQGAAQTFRLSVTAAPVFGWRLRSIGAAAHGPDGA